MKKIKKLFRNKKIFRNRVLTVFLFSAAVFNALLVLAFLKVDSYLYNREIKDYEAGKVANRDIIAEYDFKYIDKRSTAKRDYELEKNITPVFKVYKEITDDSIIKFSNFYEQFRVIHNKSMNHDKIDQLYDSFTNYYPDITKLFFSKMIEKPSVFSIMDIASETLSTIMSEGIIDIVSNDNRIYKDSDIIEIWRWKNNSREKEEVRFSEVISLDKIKNNINSRADIAKNDREMVSELVRLFAQENCFYDFQETRNKRERVLTKSEPVMKTIKKGELIVKKGFIISDTDMSKINAMGNIVISTNYRKIAGIVFFLLSVYFMSFVLFSKTVIFRKLTKIDIYLLLIMFEVYLIYSVFLFKILDLPLWFNFALLIPAPLFSVILSLLISPAVGVNFSIISSFILLLVNNFSPFPFLFSMFTGISGALLIHKIEKRIDLVFTGMKIGLTSIFYIVALSLFDKLSFSIILISSGIAFINGFVSGILVLGILPIIEHLLNSPTRFRLIELSDLNNPIFKKMHNLAPGTFNHSLNVGNLAETACREIGANPFLARAGAYYHDIGKIDQAEYFIENQRSHNKHDDMKPSLSVSVIKSHVKIGIEKGKELGLPQAVVDIIAQHHGNGIISYFYVQALKIENKARISPEDYSYTEGKPVSKEAAVVLLADNVEAAVRTLKKPTISKLEKFVWNTILSKIESRQITESELTFNDLEIISNSFIQTLAGSFHSRIEYPDEKKEKEKEK